MACCKAEELCDWCEEEDVVYTDEEGKEYCLFHAPADKKSVSLEEFNERVFEKIRRTPEEGECNLSHTTFPGNIDFSAFDEDHPLPPINLSLANFIGDARFDKAFFCGDADLGRAKFYGNTSFEKTAFLEHADFVSTEFHVVSSFKETIIFHIANFDGSQFKKSADFSGAIFNDDAYFRGSEIKGSADFSGGAFRQEVDFSEATVTGMSDFRNHAFVKKAKFSGTRFEGSTYFSEIKFRESTDFSRAYFGGAVSFERTWFVGETSFAEANFEKNTDFSGAGFIGKTDFRLAKFTKYADFQYTFYRQTGPDQHADFQNASFLSGVNFSGAQFHISVVFYRANFNNLHSFFNGTVFGRDASFQEARIASPIQFRNAIFVKDVTFMHTNFIEAAEARFDGAIFQKRADFTNTEFQNNVTFYPYPPIHVSGFSSDSTPIVAQFCGEAEFIRTSFRAKCYFKQTVFKKTARFEDLIIEKYLRFEDVDLSCVSLIEAELDNIKLLDCIWPKKKGKISERYRLIEEKLGKSSSSSIEAYYRRLKKRAVEEHNQAEISEWHYCEKEMAFRKRGGQWLQFLLYWLSPIIKSLRAGGCVGSLRFFCRYLLSKIKYYRERKKSLTLTVFRAWLLSKIDGAPQTGGGAWFLLLLYRLSSGYGERILRAGTMLLVLFAAVTLLMGWSGLEPSDCESKIQPINHLFGMNMEQIGLLIENTIQNVLFIKNPRMVPLDPVPWEFVQTIFTRIVIPIQFALFAFALRNKFRR